MEVDGEKSIGKSVPKWGGFVASSPRNIDMAISVRVSDGDSSVFHSMALGGAHFRRSL